MEEFRVFDRCNARISRITTTNANKLSAKICNELGEEAMEEIDQLALALAVKQRKTVISGTVYQEAIEDYKTSRLARQYKNEHPTEAVVREVMNDLADVSCRHKIDLHIHGEQGEIYADLTVFTNDGKEQYMATGEWLHDALKDLGWQWHLAKSTKVAEVIAAK